MIGTMFDFVYCLGIMCVALPFRRKRDFLSVIVKSAVGVAGWIHWGTRFKRPSEQASVVALISETLVSPFEFAQWCDRCVQR